jgi:tetratricopeptide (TPR) repeat protein
VVYLIETQPELISIQKDLKNLELATFSLDEKFLDPFFDPLPRGINKYIIFLFLVFTLTNIFAAFLLLIYYLTGPRRTRLSIPKNNIAKDWFFYAEKCLKYSFRDEILEGYSRALELEPENGQIKLRYVQYLATETVQNKTPATGQPVGLAPKKPEKNPFPEYKELLQAWKDTHPNEIFTNPLKVSKKEQIFALGAWLAFDTKNYTDCVTFGNYSLEIGEFSKSKKDLEKHIELLLVLSTASIMQKKIQQGINYAVKALELSQKNHKGLEAMTWELLGEYFYKNNKDYSAENCFLKAQKLNHQRWISAYRLYKIYTKRHDESKSSLYKHRYMRMQKELAPL